MPSVSPTRAFVAPRCHTDTSRECAPRGTSFVRRRESPTSPSSKMDTSGSSASARFLTPDFSSLGPVDELQGIARRLLAEVDRASIAAYCASLGSERISSLVKEVGEGLKAADSSSELKEQNIRWHHLFPVANEALNDNVAKYVAARSSNARKEVSSHPAPELCSIRALSTNGRFA